VIETVPGKGETIREYLLDAAGYPTELWASDPDAGTRRLYARYSYIECRLTHRDVFDAGGKPVRELTSDYTYDDAGHVSARVNADGTKVEYDYSCWK
jgi:YD repeat-containing protein